jgi:hypothetical protein
VPFLEPPISHESHPADQRLIQCCECAEHEIAFSRVCAL